MEGIFAVYNFFRKLKETKLQLKKISGGYW
jgi:hypothetical protein